MDKLQQLGSSSMAGACGPWLACVIRDLQQQMPGLLLGCETADQLTRLETAVRDGVATWHKPVMTIAIPGQNFSASSPECMAARHKHVCDHRKLQL